MKYYNSYRVEHFFKPDFYASQYFAMAQMIEMYEKDAKKRSTKGSKKGKPSKHLRGFNG